jgi:hypothetical protein
LKLKNRIVKDKKAFYGSRISENRIRTPEGFLICKNVPIAKVGTQQYLGEELGLEGYENILVEVVRTEQEVFSPKTIASFEGKPFTDDHPEQSEFVTTENYKQYVKGHVTNVRRGEGDFSDKLLADIIVYDKTVIEEIESGRKREISCGYGCDYGINENGNILQINITGNHVALIEEGRAGHSVRILDHNKYKKGVVKTMAKMKTKKQIIARLFPSFAKDASTTPEEIQEIVTAINEVGDEEAEVPPAQESKPTADDDVLSKVLDGIQALKDEIGELKAANQQQNDPLKKLEQQLANEVASDNNEEVATDEDITEDDDDVTTDEDITEDDDEIAADEDVAEDDDITEDDDIETSDEKTTASAADKKAMLKLIRNIRPVIAKMKDGKQKKAVTDFLIKMARATSGKSRTPKKNGYADIMKVKQRRTSQFLAKDSKIYDDSQLGKQIAKQRNPHYKLS